MFAVLVVSVDQLEVDGTPQSSVVELTNDGLGRLSWQVRHSAGWLSVEGSGFDGVVEERADGSLAGQGAGVLTIETSGVGLAAGVYADTLYVQSNGGAVAIPVSMHVAELPPDPPSSEPDGDEVPLPVGVNNGDGIFRIAFISAFEEHHDLWVMDGDGGNRVNLTSDRAYNREPMWSPDGQSIAFSRTLSSNNTGWDLWVIDADGSNLVPLTQGPSQDRHPAWSPDGRRIAYASIDEEGTSDIWVMDADGGNPVNLTPDSNIDFDPAWSPDGQDIVYASGQNSAGSTSDIWVMEANGDNPINLTASTQNVRDPAWSPDGQRIAYTCVLGEDDYQICLMNADGTEQVPLTDGALIARNPVWTPDGSRILFTAFVSKFPSPRHIFSISIDGSDVINLTEEINPDGQYTSPAVSLSP